MIIIIFQKFSSHNKNFSIEEYRNLLKYQYPSLFTVEQSENSKKFLKNYVEDLLPNIGNKGIF